MTDPETGKKISAAEYMLRVFPEELLVYFQVFLVLNKLFSERLFGSMPWWQILTPLMVSIAFDAVWPRRTGK